MRKDTHLCKGEVMVIKGKDVTGSVSVTASSADLVSTGPLSCATRASVALLSHDLALFVAAASVDTWALVLGDALAACFVQDKSYVSTIIGHRLLS